MSSTSTVRRITNEDYAQVYLSVAYKRLILNLSPCKWLPSELPRTIQAVACSVGLIGIAYGIRNGIISPHIFN